MSRRIAVSALLAAAGFFTASSVAGQQRTLEPDLPKLADGKGLEVFNRSVAASRTGRERVCVSAKAPTTA